MQFFRSQQIIFPLRSSSGVTMIELLIAIAILALLMGTAYIQVPRYINQSRDSVRKSHLEKYRIAFEEYQNDNGVYPPENLLEQCGSSVLKPYVQEVYCDPLSDEPYRYIRSPEGTSYEIFTYLVTPDDPVIALRGCENGCGPDDNNDGSGDYNYGLSSKQAYANDSGDSSEGHAEVTPTCGVQTGHPFCYSGACSECCPGNTYRCNAAGTGCYIDYSCRN